MHSFIRMLKKRVCNHPAQDTVCKIITFKDPEIYNTCLLELEKEGIKPYRCIKRINMLCFHIQGTEDTWEKLKKHPRVHHVETDIKRKRVSISPASFKPRRRKKASARQLPSSSQIPWGVQRIRAPKVWALTRGKGVKVAILDSGISPHPDLIIAGGVNIIDPNGSFDDISPDGGHGTGVAGVVAAIGKSGMIFGVAPRAELYAVMIEDEQGEISISASIEGLEWSIQNRMDVVNMSYGGLERNAAEHLMIKEVYHKGITMISVAGNDGPNNKEGIDFPGRYPEVIAVAATDQQNRIASFSSRGKGIDVSAPGVDILSLTNEGGYSVSEGTSLSAPFVTGTIALMLANQPYLSPRFVWETLIETARFLKGFKRTSQGAGLIRADLAVLDSEEE